MLWRRGKRGGRREGPPGRSVELSREVLDGILSYCRMRHPDEAILILKGRSRAGAVRAEGLVVPPFSHSGPTFAGFPHSFLPFDSSYVGMVHSHPSGSARPSVEDLHNFFGLVSVIVQHPYREADVFAWDSRGEPVRVGLPGGSGGPKRRS